MGRLDARSLAVDLLQGIGEIEQDLLDAAAPGDVEPPLAALLHPPEHVVLHLHVPGEVVLAGLDHRARRGHGVAAALHLEPIEERPVRLVIAGEDLGADDVPGLEFHEAVGPGADGLEVGGRLARLRTLERREHVSGHDAAECLGPERVRGLVDDLDGVLIRLVDPRDVAVGARRRRGRRRVGHVLPGEADVFRSPPPPRRVGVNVDRRGCAWPGRAPISSAIIGAANPSPRSVRANSRRSSEPPRTRRSDSASSRSSILWPPVAVSMRPLDAGGSPGRGLGLMPLSRSSRLTLVLACVLALLGTTSAADAQGGGSLVIALGQEPPTLDPHASPSAVTFQIIASVTENLVYRGLDGKLVPWLAESWTSARDGRSVTFKLRRDVKFHDGTPFNADAVKFNFDRIVDPKFKAGGSRSALAGYAGSKVLDEFTVQVSFENPYAPFLAYAAGGTLGIVSPKAVRETGDLVHTRPVGSGPFMIKDYVAKDRTTMA